MRRRSEMLINSKCKHQLLCLDRSWSQVRFFIFQPGPLGTPTQQSSLDMPAESNFNSSDNSHLHDKKVEREEQVAHLNARVSHLGKFISHLGSSASHLKKWISPPKTSIKSSPCRKLWWGRPSRVCWSQTSPWTSFQGGRTQTRPVLRIRY